MATKELIEEFFDSGSIAVIGATDNKNKFGNMAYAELKRKGFTLLPVNPNKEVVEGDKCFKSVKELPSEVKNAIYITKPSEAPQIIKDSAHAGIKRLWLQQGSESEEAVEMCNSYGIDVIFKKCILMYAPPVKGFHKFHQGVWRVLGKL